VTERSHHGLSSAAAPKRPKSRRTQREGQAESTETAKTLQQGVWLSIFSLDRSSRLRIPKGMTVFLLFLPSVECKTRLRTEVKVQHL
jgi:hypothetical protein